MYGDMRHDINQNLDKERLYICPGPQGELLSSVPAKNSQPNLPVSFRFLDLPKEIRFMIYEQLITRTHRNVTTYYTVTSRMIEQGEHQPLIVPMILVVPDPVPPIHISCRMIYNEATSLLKKLYMAHSVARIIFPSAPGVAVDHYEDCINEILWMAEMGWDHYAKVAARADWEMPEDEEIRGELCTLETRLKCSDCEPLTSSIPDRIKTFIPLGIDDVATMFDAEDATDVVTFAERCVEKRSYCYPDLHGGELHIAFLETALADRDIDAILDSAWMNPSGCSPRITLYDAFRSPRETKIQTHERKHYGGVIDTETWGRDWA
jgi:hypothetical protein